MEKVATWHGMTWSHGFHVDVTRDAKSGTFVANIQTSSPALVPQHVPGTPVENMRFDDPEELRHEDLEKLRELTKQRIAKRCGKLLQFVAK